MKDGLYNGETIVSVGVFLYDGAVECDLQIVRSSICYGSGDDEHPPDIADDHERETFYIRYGSTTERGTFNSASGAFFSLDDAIAAVEKMPLIGTTVTWRKAT